MLSIFYALICLLVVLGLAHAWSKASFDKYAAALMESVTGRKPGSDVHTVDPSELPSLVRSFAERSGADPDQLVRGVRFRQSARLRMAPDKAWQTLATWQVTAATEPGFAWLAKQMSGPLTILQVVDAYVRGKGFLKARLFGSVPIASAGGPALDRSELMRYLAELAWSPDAIFHNPELRWSNCEKNRVRVETDSNEEPVSVDLYFDEHGDLIEIRADQREAIEGGKTVKRPWRGLFSEYREIGGRRIPARGEVGYVYDSGYSAYFQGEIVEYEVIT